MSRAILVLGGTGTVGAPLVQALVDMGETVKVATRNPSKIPVAGAQAVPFDFADPSTLDAAFDGVDRAYVMSPAGYADHVGLLFPIIDAAAKYGAKVVLQSAIGVDSDDNIPLRQVELKLQKSGIPSVILRPNWFADNFSSYWLHDILNGKIRVPAGDGKSSFIDARDIAAAAAAALTTAQFDNQAFVLTGPEAIGYAEAAALLSKASGRSIEYSSIDGDSFVATLKAAGVSADYAEMLNAIFYPVREGWTAPVTNAVKTLTGKAPRTLAAYIAENAGAFAAKRSAA